MEVRRRGGDGRVERKQRRTGKHLRSREDRKEAGNEVR